MLDEHRDAILTRLSPSGYLIIGLAFQALLLPSLWGHQSDNPIILGRYSVHYSLILLSSLIITFGWTVLIIIWERVINFLNGLSLDIVVISIISSGVLLFILWHTSIAEQFLVYLSYNWWAFTVVLAFAQPDRTIRFAHWMWLLLAVGLLLLPSLAITSATKLKFSPDEGHWADMATTYWLQGGVYARTWYMTPYKIGPGLGWSVPAYGWLLEHLGYRLYIGRLWNFSMYVIAFTGVWLVSNHLYGRHAAAISTTAAILGRIVFAYDYRPDHQLTAAGIILVFITLKAQDTEKRHVALALHGLCGLLATLSMQLHAAGIVFAVGLSLLYLLDVITIWRRAHRTHTWSQELLLPIFAFAAGALVGTIIYFVCNIWSIGGLDVYLGNLVSSRWSWDRPIIRQFLQWPFLERPIVWGGLLYLLWRRRASDRRYLTILACILIGAFLLDTQGYPSIYSVLLMVPAGTLVIDGFSSPGILRGKNLRAALIGTALVVVLFAQSSGMFVEWGNVIRWVTGGGREPYFYEELAKPLESYLSQDDVILGPVSMVWAFPHYQLVTSGAEYAAQQRFRVSSREAVWEAIQPSVVVYVHNEMEITPAIQQYMDSRAFERCHTLNVMGRTIEIYRQDCQDAANQ